MLSTLKSKRIERGLSQCDLYKQTDVGPWRISQFERGLIPSMQEARRIAEVLGSDVKELFPALQEARS